MSHRYWGATACAVGFAISWLMPAYMTLEGGAVWPSEVGRGWTNRDADGHPLHDDLGNRIKPNPVRHGGVARRQPFQPVVLRSHRHAHASRGLQRAEDRHPNVASLSDSPHGPPLGGLLALSVGFSQSAGQRGDCPGEQ